MQFDSISPSILDAFWKAADASNLDALDGLFQQNPALATCKKQDGSTLLHEAVKRDNTAAAAHLIVHGADLEAKDSDGLTAALRAWGDRNLSMASCFNMSTFIRFKPEVDQLLDDLIESPPKDLSISDPLLRVTIKPSDVDPYRIHSKKIK